MRILYVTHSSNLAGSNKALLNIIQKVIILGHDILVVTDNKSGLFLEALDNLKVPYRECRVIQSTWHDAPNILKKIRYNIKNFLREYRSFVDVDKIVHEFKPDLIHTNVGPLAAGIMAALKNSIPHVWHQREYTNRYPGLCFFPSFGVFLKLTHLNNNFNICITKGVFNNINGRKECDQIIYDGVFSINNLPVVQKEKIDYVLFVGNVHPGKGTKDVIINFLKFNQKHPGYELLIVGNYDEKDSYYQECIYLCKNKEDKIKFLGLCKNVYTIMAKAKMIVINSEYEGFGFVAAEAMLNDCLVIGRNTTGTKEQFDEGLAYYNEEIGFRFSNNIEMLACMHRAVEEDTTIIRQHAREIVIKKYTLEQNVDAIIELYKKILQNEKKSTCNCNLPSPISPYSRE